MPPIILAINAGSSSVKATVFTTPNTDRSSDDPRPIANCSIDGLTAPPAKLNYQHHNSEYTKKDIDNVGTQEEAFKKILEHLEKDSHLAEIKSRDDIKYVCHRVVHGGTYPEEQVIDRETYHHLENLSDLAPLHNGPALSIVRLCTTLLPHATNVAFFDTSFHHTIPAHIHTYPIDRSIAQHNGLRQYGFHGLSYAFITRSVASYLSTPHSKLNIIALHLGSGCSAAAISSGTSRATTMGLTPLAGLPGATRSGDIDPSLIFHYTHRAGRPSRNSTKDLHLTYAEEILNKQSGWKALTGTTDFGEISTKAEKGDEACKLAFDLLVERIAGVVGNYYVVLGGKIDALVFAGGIGEKGIQLRSAVGKKVACLGFSVDEGRNQTLKDDIVVDIGAQGKAPRVLVCQTDEQAEMGRGCLRMMRKKAKQ